MRRKQIVGAILAVVMAIALFYCVNRANRVLDNAQGMITEELAKSFNTTVTVGGIKLNAVNSISLLQTCVYDTQGTKLIAVPEIKASFDLLKLLKGEVNITALTSVELITPDILLKRLPGGQWNYENILKGQAKEEAKFKGLVWLNDASVTVALPEGTVALEKVNGSLSYINSPTAAFDLEGLHNNSNFTMSGSAGANNRLSVSLDLKEAKLEEYQGFIPQKLSITDVHGNVRNIHIAISADQDKTFYTGNLDVSDLNCAYKGYKVAAGRGLVSFTKDDIYFYQTDFLLNGEKIALSGNVKIDGSEPVVNLQTRMTDAELQRLLPNLPYQVTASLEGTVTGRLSDLTAAGKFNARTLQGTISGDGKYEVASQKYCAKMAGNGIDMKAAGAAAGLTGSADFDVVVDGQADLPPAHVYGTVRIPEGAVRSIPFTNAYAALNKQGSEATLSYLTANIDSGSMTMDGKISGDNLALHVNGQGINLRLLKAVFGEMSIAGSADFNGQIAGTLKNPDAQLSFAATSGEVLLQPFEEATGVIQLCGDKLYLQNVALTNGRTRHEINGVVNVADETVDTLAVSSHMARAENIIELLSPGEKLTGNVDNEVFFTGPLKNLSAHGKIVLTDGSFRGQLVQKAEGSYKRENGRTTIENMNVSSLNTQISVAGTLDPDRSMDFSVTADDIDIERLHFHFPYSVGGRASFRGRLTGMPDRPDFSGTLHAGRLLLNGQEIKDISGMINVKGQQVEVPTFSFHQNGSAYQFSGGYNEATNDIYGGLDVEKADISALLAILNVPQKHITGQIDGHIIVGGKADNPNIWVTGQLAQGKIKDYPLENIEVDLVLNNNVLTINRLTAAQGQGMLAAQGSVDFNGNIDVEIGGQKIDAGLLTALFDTPLVTSGQLNFAAQVDGTINKPHAAISMEIDNGSLGSAAFDVLYGLFVVDKQSINVNQVYIAKGPYRASAYGMVPLKALDVGQRSQASLADQMDLKIKLDQANLSILPLLTKEVSWAAGQTSGEITLTGTLSRPRVYGRVAVNDGVVKLAVLDTPIQKVGVDIEFEGDKIDVRTFEGKMGSGYYTLNGSVGLSGWALANYDLSLIMDNLGVDSKYFDGPLNGRLQLSTVNNRPHLAGNILLERDTINIPVLPEAEEQQLDIGLDVAVKVGNRVRLYNPYLYDVIAEGQLNIAGSSKAPDITGQVRAVRGTVSYLRTPFKIKEGTAAFNRFGSFEPLIRLHAQTRLEDTVINMDVNGPLSQMEFRLSSEPNMGQREIMTLLTLRGRSTDNNNNNTVPNFGREEMLSLLDAGLQMRFVSELENTLRNALGLDDFRFIYTTVNAGEKTEKDSSDRDMLRERQVYNIQIGKYVTDRLMLNYTTAIDYEAYTFGFQYDLTRQISLGGSINEQNKRRFGLEMRFSF